MEKSKRMYIVGGKNKMTQSLWKTLWWFLKKFLKRELPQFHFLYSQKFKLESQRDIDSYNYMFIAVLFTLTKIPMYADR